MVVPKSVQVYFGNSGIYGKYGDPWEVRGGLNWYPVKQRGFRVNTEWIHVDHVARRVHRVSDARRCERQRLSRQSRAELLIDEVNMTRRPWSRSAAVLSAFLALTLPGVFFERARALDAQGQGAANEFNDSHFHLTNYIQQGIDVRTVPEDHGQPRRPFDAVRHSAAAAVVVRQLRRFRADLLPADRRAALLLLVHRRLHRQRLPRRCPKQDRRASTR